jgi:DnaJ-domain-containing protein 1
VSIGKRLIDLAKSELNSLLDRAAQIDDDGDGERGAAGAGRGRGRLEDLSDEELEAEIERRRLDREIEERARRARPAGGTSGGAGAGAGASAGSRGPRPAAASSPGDPVARAYAALEVPVGSDFDTVRKAYRNLMRKYHPDRHASSPEKQKSANELAQKLTESYKLLEKRLR